MPRQDLAATAVRPHSPHAWWLAARPKTLTAALVPVLAASALALADGRAALVPMLLCVGFALLMQVAANFINDLIDYRRGTDRADRLGPERACAQGWISPRAMRGGIVVVLVAACAVGLGLTAYGGWQLVWLGAACVVFAFLYTLLLSYCGLGDLLVWSFFGLVPVAGTYYVQALRLTPEVWVVGAACGLAIDNLLVVNNFRDRYTDRLSGKRTLIVFWGARFGSWFYLLQGYAAYGCALWLAGRYGWPCAVLPLVYVAAHTASWWRMRRIWSGRALNGILASTSMGIMLFGLTLAAALCLSALG